MKKRGYIVGSICGALMHSFGGAQTPQDTLTAHTLEEVVVTGTRTSRKVATLPLPVQIITAAQIQKSGVSRLNEIIQEQTGLLMVPDFGGGEGIQLQGLDAAYVQILVDGQPLMGRRAGTLDLSRITVHNIERIEIVKGASSSLYGSEALAGVVNIITKKTPLNAPLQGNILYRAASFDTHDVATSFTYGKKKVGVEWFANYFKTQGYALVPHAFQQTVEPYYNLTLQPKLRLHLSDRFHGQWSTRLFHQEQVYKAVINAEPLRGLSRQLEWNVSGLFHHQLTSEMKLIYDLYATRYQADEFLNQNNGQRVETTTFDQWFYRPEVRWHGQWGKHRFTSGVGMTQESLDRTYFKEQVALQSYYVLGQWEGYLGASWNVLAGFRYDRHFQYPSQWSPKLAFNYRWNDHFSLKIAAGYGYKAPDLRQLYFNFTNATVGYAVLGYNVVAAQLAALQNQGQLLFVYPIDLSEPLQPERSFNLNWGGYYQKERFTLEYNLFYNRIRDLIDTRAVAQQTNGQNVFSYFNVDQIFTYGLELNSQYTFPNGLHLAAGYQYLIAKDQAVVDRIERGEVFARDPVTLSTFALRSQDYVGLFNRSQHTANVKVRYRLPRWKTEILTRLLYRSKYGVFDTNGNAILDRYDDFVQGFFQTNLTLTQEFTSKINLQLGVNNAFDYTDAANIPNLPGRQWFARIHYQF